MELRQVRCFLAVADLGSFRRASEVLHLTQSAVSQAVARLEAELGAELFDRPGRGHRVSVSVAGIAFMPSARLTVQAATQARAAVRAVVDNLVGRLEIAVPVYPSLLAAPIERFHAAHPDVTICLHGPGTRSHEQVLELVQSGVCEIGVMASRIVPHDVIVAPLASQNLAVYFPAGTEDVPERMTFAEVAHWPLVAPLRGSAERDLWDRALGREQVLAHVVAEAEYFHSRLELVQDGVGVTVGPFGLPHRSAGDLRLSRITDLQSKWSMVARQEPLSAAASAFWSHVIEMLAVNTPNTNVID